ncbi:hypothetical protein [endosymbiont GvMRE of Glomus versiforme]|uniref:hypothetical protein n=1 Tax=endosymbiont GvMRE of Glomus versiforme TaxID=2039283 RepID=UPI000EC98FA4|nr:hypothetical protein [endosymbiont GvMRE of Glomus versiforme]RHZ36081.1 hypothetical protein GvMRE_Ic3g98 [endosymbiont GvMRE of Glomus versiforme]
MNDAQQHLNQITKKGRIYYLDISNRDLAGNADLSEFTPSNILMPLIISLKTWIS